DITDRRRCAWRDSEVARLMEAINPPKASVNPAHCGDAGSVHPTDSRLLWPGNNPVTKASPHRATLLEPHLPRYRSSDRTACPRRAGWVIQARFQIAFSNADAPQSQIITLK